MNYFDRSYCDTELLGFFSLSLAIFHNIISFIICFMNLKLFEMKVRTDEFLSDFIDSLILQLAGGYFQTEFSFLRVGFNCCALS